MSANSGMRTAHGVGRERLVGHLAMLCFAALIAGSFSLGAEATKAIAPAALNAIRFVCGAVILLAAVAATNKGRLPRPRAAWRYLVLGGLMAFYFTAMFIALSFTSPVSISAVFTLTPLMSAGFGLLLLKQVPRPIVVVSLIAASLGALYVIFRGDLGALVRFEVGSGEVIFFFGCIGHAIYAPMVRRLHRGEALVVFAAYSTAAIALWVVIYGLPAVLATDWLHLPALVWWSIGYLAFGTTAVTFFLMQVGATRMPAAKVMAYGYLVPSFVIVYEGMAGHGWPNAAIILGALVTMMGLVVLYFTPDS